MPRSSSRPACEESAADKLTARADWLAITPGGHVAGSRNLIEMLEWRAGGVSLPAEAARAVCDHPEIVARAMRGETTGTVKFPTKK